MSNNENQTKENKLKSLKEINKIEELDLSKVEQIRGKTPIDIKERCLQLCKHYLSGNWEHQTIHTINVKRITGGFMNQLYFCGITKPDDNNGVPQEVAIRLYGQNIFEFCDKQRIRDNVISLMFSENGLGPKVYGIFEGGIIQKYYPHRQFKEDEQKNQVMVKKVFKTLAFIHSLVLPLKKDPWWFYDLMVRFYEIAFNKFPLKQLMEENNCQTLMTNDLKSEIIWVKGVIERTNSPLVFTHNDFRSSNLLIVEPNDDLVVCDYDISGYSFRGYDFVSLMREWGRKQFQITKLEGLPIEDSVFIPLIEIYIKESQRIFGEKYLRNEINSKEHILKEVKTFLLFSYLFGTVFCLKMDEKDDDFPINKNLCMELADKSFKDYFLIKKILSEQKVIS